MTATRLKTLPRSMGLSRCAPSSEAVCLDTLCAGSLHRKSQLASVLDRARLGTAQLDPDAPYVAPTVDKTASCNGTGIWPLHMPRCSVQIRCAQFHVGEIRSSREFAVSSAEYCGSVVAMGYAPPHLYDLPDT